MDFQRFLESTLADERSNIRSRSIRALANWLLNLFRNVVAVGFFFVVAHKSGRWYLNLLAWAGLGALCIYLISYLQKFRVHVSALDSRWLRALLTTSAVAVVGLLLICVTLGLSVFVNEIARVQIEAR